MFWLHYQGSGPKATLWDEWLSSPTLWPALEKDNAMQYFREQWNSVLGARGMDPEGYVATHQHGSIAHQLGWPFPFWKHGGENTWGWHFSLQNVPEGWHGTEEKTREGWGLFNGTDEGIHDLAWNFKLSSPGTTVTTPTMRLDVLQSPFLQLRWRASGLGKIQPYVDWTTTAEPTFTADKRFYFEPIESANVVYTMIPMHRHPKWTGQVTQLRIHFNNPQPAGVVGIQAFFAQYDTRHNINQQNFVRGCARYFFWTRDLNFLRREINRMRTAIRYVMTEFDALKENVVVTRYVGHCGRSGLKWNPDGTKTLRHGVGIGNNYWDLLPMGYKDAYATIHYYDALKHMAAVERAIVEHPEWNVPGGVLALDADQLEKHAAQVKRTGNRLFWNRETKRFVTGVDVDGAIHDYGFTFINLEAIFYDFADKKHANDIMSWICGERMVEGDTSQGADIYHWRFGPRSTTKRNIEYYGWFWSGPENIPWGGQVQDGGAVLGFSYHDLMARLKARGPENAAARLAEITKWFDEVTAAGGYRKYYDGSREGTMQGGGTAGGLGLDMEFFESILVPQVIIDGFLGFRPMAEGFSLEPKLPHDWQELKVNRIRLHEAVLTVRVAADAIDVQFDKFMQSDMEPWTVQLPEGPWRLSFTPESVSFDGRGQVVPSMVANWLSPDRVQVTFISDLPVTLGFRRTGD
ncbi:MAG: hypothetical protein HY706_04085 [Candidatus Hydrogenedentes bacterium]|nr:hypothetical protein [Candidatus Hydrogenedentota bacterium]